MKFIADNILYIGLALGSGVMLLWPALLKGGSAAKNATPSEAVMLMNRQNATVLDVREPAEFEKGHIAGAIHIPLGQLAERAAELDKYRDKPLLVTCQGGVRSGKACNLLVKQQFSQLHNLQGGINAWQEAKLPLVKV